MSSVPEQEVKFDYKAWDEQQKETARRKAKAGIKEHLHAYREASSFDREATERLYADLRTLKLKDYKGIAFRQLGAELNLHTSWLYNYDLEVEFSTHAFVGGNRKDLSGAPDESVKVNFSKKQSFPQGRGADGKVKVITSRGTRSDSMSGNFSAIATIEFPVSTGSFSSPTKGLDMSLQMKEIELSEKTHFHCKRITHRTVDGEWTGFGTHEFLSDTTDLIKSAIQSGGIPVLWHMLERILTEQEMRRTRITLMPAFDLRVCMSVFRNAQVRLVLEDGRDVVGVIRDYSIGREGVIEMVTPGGTPITVARSKVRGIVPWKWSDSDLLFSVRALYEDGRYIS